ncbi:MAG: metallophosphatase family protein [Chloroflexi bacterium]|nr:metallophosphatase family protein [Chloroflexota bacterium]MBU1748949.1 metallophosphatase family protein [Chloroflexota bacterium]
MRNRLGIVSERGLRIGLVADTHIPDRAMCVPPAALEALRGVDLILHAGDISAPAALAELRQLAPVLAVRGNNAGDRRNFSALPRRLTVRVGPYRIGVAHGVQNLPQRLSDFVVGKLGYKHTLIAPVGRRARRQFGPLDALVFGHIHWPWIGNLDGVLMVNPGALCGRRDRALALMDVTPGGLRARLVYLDPPRQPRDSQFVARLLRGGRITQLTGR